MSARNRATLSENPWRLEDLSAVFRVVRAQSEQLVEPLAPEDCVIQSMADVSPMKWHLAHTTWFFETFLLQPFIDNYVSFDPAYAYLFNSYYEGAGPRHARAQRGLLSRPTVGQVIEYRQAIDRRMQGLLNSPPSDFVEDIRTRMIIGLNHEQQHQELMSDGHQARFFDESSNACLHARARRACRPIGRSNAVALDVARGRAHRDRLFGARVLLRQRNAASPRVSSGPTPWPTVWSRTRNTSRSSRTEAINGPNCGFPTAGTR